MKISPNREQFMLVMIMNGLVIFIILVISIEMILSAKEKIAQADQLAVARLNEAINHEKIADSSQPDSGSPPLATDLKLDESRLSDHPEKLTLPRLLPKPESEHEQARNKPPLPIQNPALRAANKPVEEPVLIENGYAVQLGAFSSEEKAAALVAKLSTLKFEGKALPVTQRSVNIGNKVMYRVRLGPFSSQARAKMAAGLASREAAVEGTVLRADQ